MKPILRAAIIVALVLSVLVVGGCSLIAQKAAENATGVSVSKNGNQVTVNGPNGSATVQNNQNQLPAGLPDSVPTYSGSIKGSSAVDTPSGSAYTYTITSSDDAKTIVDWYSKNLAAKGWTVEQTATLPNGGVIGAKMGTNADIAVTVSEDNGQRAILVVVHTKK